MVLFFFGSLTLSSLSKAKMKAKSVTAMNNLKQIGLAAQMAAEENNGKLPVTLDALTNQLGSDKLLTDTESGQRFIYVAGGENLDNLPGNSVLAYAPTDKKERAVLFADGRVAVIKDAELSGLTSFFKNTVVQTTAPPVLAHFQVQQNGNAIRVVDADGSVYDGSLQPEGAVAQNAPAPAQVEKAKEITSRDESQAAQNVSFRVSGTNKTLKQNVVFTGNLLAISDEKKYLPQSFGGSSGLAGGGGGGGNQIQSPPTNQLSWSNSRIAGTAVVADTNSIEINAVPLPP